ncbi:tyrosine-type recombinase/integrase [Hyphomicrobium sp.]|uniref:tyrosine-type recombinase/integrase n=1 Tax=Hyphomicrobium sp. TaxID=82 RepID=UPI0025B81593|nr:tyrosine-type recombinase/integrase [Hyphomicrobium sp.]
MTKTDIIPQIDFLSKDALKFLKASLAPNTLRAYAAQLKAWEQHCEEQSVAPYPASPVAVANWIAERANHGRRGGRRIATGEAGQAISSVRTVIPAIRAAHVAKGLSFDTRHQALRGVLQGIKREKAEAPNQSAALPARQLLDILEGLADDLVAVRDAALLALGFAAARRRSELVGLDLDRLGEGSGFLMRNAKDFRIVLVRGKTVTDDDDPIIVNREDNREAAKAIDRWLDQAGIASGEPVFRSFRKGDRLQRERLSADYVPRIVKARVAQHLVRSGVPEKLAFKEAARYAAHSLRHGFATSAAEAGASTLEIASVTGHRSQTILARYVRQADKNNLRPGRRIGVGLRRDV